MFTRRAHGIPVLIAGFVGRGVAGLTVFAEKLNLDAFDVGFMWPSTLGVLTTIVIGYVLSWIIPSPTNDNGKTWTFLGMMRNRRQPAWKEDK